MWETAQQVSLIAVVGEELSRVKPTVQIREFRPADKLSTLGLDSADIIDLMASLEDRLEIEISDEDAMVVETFADLVTLLIKYRDGD